ncbi:MAG TPA: SH3 domain-containing protein, partial [Candidatus Limnocylindria bacterium]|nr:SH3 domain-containing protein [Candidatus Limnocylindria bacterium]
MGSRTLAALLCVTLACTPQPTTSTSPTPAVTSAAPSATIAPPPTPTTTCPAVRAISPGAVTGRYTYPAGIQNNPPFPITLVKVDDPSVFRSVHTQPAAPLAVRQFAIFAVEPGTYYAVGYFTPEHIAAFTPAVGCGLGAGCTDHSLTRVTVRAGETVSGVDVMDWAVPRDSVPPPPAGSAGLGRGANVRICNPYADSLNVRASAGLNFPVRRTLDNGAVVVVRDGPLPADGYDWYEVNLAND